MTPSPSILHLRPRLNMLQDHSFLCAGTGCDFPPPVAEGGITKRAAANLQSLRPNTGA